MPYPDEGNTGHGNPDLGYEPKGGLTMMKKTGTRSEETELRNVRYAEDELTEALATLRSVARRLTEAGLSYDSTFAKVQVGRSRDRILEAITITKDARDILRKG